MRSLRSSGLLLLVASCLLGSGCEASTSEDSPLGELVYSGPLGGLHRFDRRVEDVPSEASAERQAEARCGYLTPRAEAEIDRVLSGLDPEGKYAIDVQACRSRWGEDATSTRIHIEGFTHSPFICAGEQECCAKGMDELLVLYDRVVAHLQGHGKEHDAIRESLGLETYPLLEPDESCRPSRSAAAPLRVHP